MTKVTYEMAQQQAHDILASEPDVRAVLISTAGKNVPELGDDMRSIECHQLVPDAWQVVTRAEGKKA